MSEEYDALSLSNIMATLADMSDPEMVREWAEDVAQLEAENERLKRELRSERIARLGELMDADIITREQYSEQLRQITLLCEDIE